MKNSLKPGGRVCVVPLMRSLSSSAAGRSVFGVICMLKARGVNTIIASDYLPGRRELARRRGVYVVVDPAKDSPYRDWKDRDFIGTMPELLKLSHT